jgi:thymidylate synthase (FAD)
MIKHKHWSPFEMANVCVEINTTRDIARQILRHRSFSFQEFSQRYADPTFFDFGLKECRMEDLENRQNSLFCSDEETAKWWMEMQKEIWFSAVDIYKQARRRGIAKEVARSVLPEGLTPSRMFMNGTLRSWIHYLELRTGVETQAEHRVIAWECLYIIASVFPLIKERIVSGEENSSNSEKD